ncbi:hypothetical protein Ocin01_14281 [Orchesella cincta]|uniref:C2H2-type domain-containing protein n=1 Tax=Orchesella cincta TaxID=48709 RepID=A0A1D2MHU7_ORCCI|nr:hypothetical protein Ocin01_14281 [Orchesella cincta]
MLTQLLSTLETSLNHENGIYPANSIKKEGIDVEISHENDEDVASPLRKNVESRKREGVLAIEGGSFEVYWTSSESEPDMDSLECSKCPQVAFFSTDSEDGMELAYQKIKIHCLLMHSTEVWKNLGSPSSLIPCRLCNVVFKESPERDRHEFMHHKAYEILHGPGLLTEERVILDSKKNKQIMGEGLVFDPKEFYVY